MDTDRKDRNISYHLLKSIVGSGKSTFQLNSSFGSFKVIGDSGGFFVDPTFKKIIWADDHPKVILISAMGATGKTTLAKHLSHEVSLPLLDLSKHKPVGDNTLTGLITSTFQIKDLSAVFQGIGDGSYGIIIDGIDEGRSMTNGKAFDAFLDNVVNLCHQTPNLSFLLLGRTQVLEECWIYLDDKGISTNMISIAPFSLDNAKRYIDASTDGLDSAQKDQYIIARDFVLRKLQGAFVDKRDVGGSDFLQFIGYPPVLDAVTTLLLEEKNYHRIIESLKIEESSELEISLLQKISTYILVREKDQKVVPNIIGLISSALSSVRQKELSDTCFSIEEQCVRLLSYCSNQKISLKVIQEEAVNTEYEALLEPFIKDHPFLNGRNFRNTVFESLVIAVLLGNSERWPESKKIIYSYLATHKHSYYLIYFMENLGSTSVPSDLLKFILYSALEFRSSSSKVELTIDDSSDNVYSEGYSSSFDLLDVGIDIYFSNERSKTFLFHCFLLKGESINVGSNLGNTFISVAHDLVLGGEAEIELTTPIQIFSKSVYLQASSLLIRQSPSLHDIRSSISDDELVDEVNKSVFFEGISLKSSLEKIDTNGLNLMFAFENDKNISYPVIQYFKKKAKQTVDPLLRDKYVALRKVLMEFRSHSRGTMARFKDKIESDQVVGSEIGKRILHRLLNDKVLTLSGKFYFLAPEAVHKYLGVSWLDIRNGQTSQKLDSYLESIY